MSVYSVNSTSFVESEGPSQCSQDAAIDTAAPGVL